MYEKAPVLVLASGFLTYFRLSRLCLAQHWLGDSV